MKPYVMDKVVKLLQDNEKISIDIKDFDDLYEIVKIDGAFYISYCYFPSKDYPKSITYKASTQEVLKIILQAIKEKKKVHIKLPNTIIYL